MLEISTVGAKVLYAAETTAGTRPTTGYTNIPNINQAPEIAMEQEALDASDISDKVTRYIAGRADPGGNAAFTANHTDAFITAWETLVDVAATAKADGKRVWFEYWYPDAKNGFFFAAEPHALGNNGIEQNSVDTIPATVTVADVEGWSTAIAETTTTATSET